jgi:hypothetical protein
VVIESVSPEIDGGRCGKEGIHDWLEVPADIFSEVTTLSWPSFSIARQAAPAGTVCQCTRATPPFRPASAANLRFCVKLRFSFGTSQVPSFPLSNGNKKCSAAIKVSMSEPAWTRLGKIRVRPRRRGLGLERQQQIGRKAG